MIPFILKIVLKQNYNMSFLKFVKKNKRKKKADL